MITAKTSTPKIPRTTNSPLLISSLFSSRFPCEEAPANSKCPFREGISVRVQKNAVVLPCPYSAGLPIAAGATTPKASAAEATKTASAPTTTEAATAHASPTEATAQPWAAAPAPAKQTQEQENPQDL